MRFRKNQGEFLGGFGKIEGSFRVVSEKSRGVFSRSCVNGILMKNYLHSRAGGSMGASISGMAIPLDAIMI